jgi:phosphoribosyl-ATP pyrophosphohydrolase
MLKNKIIEETVETIIDKLYQESEYYMYEYGEYSESNNKFIEDQEEIVVEIIKELYNRVRSTE